MPFKAITGKQEAAFVSSLRAGQYNLLLGAGFSMDSKNAKGPLPSGEELLGDLAGILPKRRTRRRAAFSVYISC
jgi:hypothetical protein